MSIYNFLFAAWKTALDLNVVSRSRGNIFQELLYSEIEVHISLFPYPDLLSVLLFSFSIKITLNSEITLVCNYSVINFPV